MRNHPQSSRRGVAIIWLLTVLVILTALISAVTWQHVAGRRWTEGRQRQLQAQWLARAGVELAVSQLLVEGKGYSVTSTTLLPGWEVAVTVQPKPGSAVAAAAFGAVASPVATGLWTLVPILRVEPMDAFAVMSIARCRTDDPPPVVYSVARRFRRQTGGDRVQVVPITPEMP